MKRPDEIIYYPLDFKKDEDGGGMYFYLPEWVVRAYKLKDSSFIMGRVKFVIKARNRAMFEYKGEEDGGSAYFKRNWFNKIQRERKKARLEQKIKELGK